MGVIRVVPPASCLVWVAAGSWFERTRDRGKKSYRDRSLFDWCAAFLPCLAWLRTYKIKEFLMVCSHFVSTSFFQLKA